MGMLELGMRGRGRDERRPLLGGGLCKGEGELYGTKEGRRGRGQDNVQTTSGRKDTGRISSSSHPVVR